MKMQEVRDLYIEQGLTSEEASSLAMARRVIFDNKLSMVWEGNTCTIKDARRNMAVLCSKTFSDEDMLTNKEWLEARVVRDELP